MSTSSGNQTDTVIGATLVAVSAVAFSTAGFFTRMITLDVWTMLFWRGLFGALAILVFIVWREGTRTSEAFSLDRPAVLVALGSALSTICFIGALRLTSVAQVTVIFATTPFVAAALSWFWTGRRESATTLVASIAALIGATIAAGDGPGEMQLLGAVLALLASVITAAVMVVLQQNPRVSFLPAGCLAGLLLAAIVGPFSSPRLTHGLEFVWLIGFGGIQFALGLTLLVVGTPLITATRAALIGSLETPLAPLLVWITFAEEPGRATLIGGAIVMAAVTGDVLLSRTREG